MADKLYFSRDTRVVVRLTGQDHAFEIPVLDGYAFSQATNSSEITLNEMADSDGNSRRARQMFNDSYSPAEWSFSTYAQPLHQVGTGQSAVEAPLWALLAGKAEYTDGAGTNAVWQDGANTYGQEVSDTVNKWKLDFTQSNKSALGTADIYFVMGSANSPTSAADMAVYKVEGCCVNEAGFDFDMEGLTTISWSGLGKLVSQITPGHGTTVTGTSEIFYKSDDASLHIKNVSSGHTAVNKYESDNFIRNRLTQLTISDRDSVGLEAIRNLLSEVGSLGMDINSGVWSSPYSISQSSGGSYTHTNLVPDADIAGAEYNSTTKFKVYKSAINASGSVTNLLDSSQANNLTDVGGNPLIEWSTSHAIEEDISYRVPDSPVSYTGVSRPDYVKFDISSYSSNFPRIISLNLGHNSDAMMVSGNPIATNTQVTCSVWLKIPDTAENVSELVFFMGDPVGPSSSWSYNNVTGILVDITDGVPTLQSWASGTTTNGTGSANVTTHPIECNSGWMRLAFTTDMVAGSQGYQLGSVGDQHLGIALMTPDSSGNTPSFDPTNSDLETQFSYSIGNTEVGIVIGGIQIETGSTLTPYHDGGTSEIPKLLDMNVTSNQHAFPAAVETFIGGASSTNSELATLSLTNNPTTSTSHPAVGFSMNDINSTIPRTALAADAYTTSVYVKRSHSDVRYCQLTVFESLAFSSTPTGSPKGCVLDFDNGTLLTSWSNHNSGATVTDEGNGWYRLSIPNQQLYLTLPTSNNYSERHWQLRFGDGAPVGSSGVSCNPSVLGTTKGIYFGGWQVEAGSSVSTLNNSTAQVGGTGGGTTTTTTLAVTTNQSALPTAVETSTGLSSSADKITLGGTGNHSGRYMVTADLDSATASSLPTGAHTFSAYVKRTDASVKYLSMQVFDTSSTSDVTAVNSPAGVVYNFDTTSFETVSAFSGTSNSASTTDSGWTRISFTADVPTGSNPRLGLSFAGTTGFTSGNVAPLETKHSEVSTHGIEVGAIQMEAGTVLNAYQNQNNRPQDSNGTAKAFGLTLTGGNITIANNMTFLTPETMGAVDVPLGHVTGTRSISGSFTCYLNSEDDSSAELFKDIIDGRLTTNDFDLGFGIGNGGTGNDVPRIEIDLDHCHLELPTHNIEDVVSLETNFHALPTTVDDKDELTIKYVSSEA